MIRCRIARLVNGAHVQYLAFIGPSIDHVPAGWSIVLRRSIKR